MPDQKIRKRGRRGVKSSRMVLKSARSCWKEGGLGAVTIEASRRMRRQQADHLCSWKNSYAVRWRLFSNRRERACRSAIRAARWPICGPSCANRGGVPTRRVERCGDDRGGAIGDRNLRKHFGTIHPQEQGGRTAAFDRAVAQNNCERISIRHDARSALRAIYSGCDRARKLNAGVYRSYWRCLFVWRSRAVGRHDRLQISCKS